MVNVWRVDSRDKNEFHQARMGDHLMIPFECDLCVFRKLFFRNPILGASMDVKALAVIRRMILDTFWSRAVSKVEANARTTQK
jgi:hypothetical protein